MSGGTFRTRNAPCEFPGQHRSSLTTLRHPRTLVYLFALGALLRIIAFAARPPGAVLIAPDEQDYYAIASSVAQGDGFSLGGHPTAYRDMLFVAAQGYLLRWFGGSSLPFHVFQIACDLSSALLLFHIGRKRFGEQPGILLAAAWLFYPAAIMFTALFLTETLFVTLTLLALFCYDRWEAERWSSEPRTERGIAGYLANQRWPILLGISLGLAALTRSVGLIFLAAVLLYVFLFRYEIALRVRIREVALIFSAAFVIIAPWMIRNAVTLHTFALNTNSGINLLIGNNPEANGSYIFSPAMNDALPAETTVAGRANEALIDRYAASLAREHFFAHTGGAMELWPRKFAYLWSSDMALWVHYDPTANSALGVAERLRARPIWQLALLALPYMLIVLAGTAGIFLTPHFLTRGLFILQLTLLAIATFATYGAARYHFPFMPPLMISAASLIRPKFWTSAPEWRRTFLLSMLGIFGGIWLFEIVRIFSAS